MSEIVKGRKRVSIVSFYAPPAVGSAHTFVANLVGLLATTADVTLIGSEPASTPTLRLGSADVAYRSVPFVTLEERLKNRIRRDRKSSSTPGVTKAIEAPASMGMFARAKAAIWYSIIPDRQVMWARAATLELVRQRKNPPDHIIGVFRPSSSLIAAMLGAKLMRVPWTAILMDPWSEMESSFELRPSPLKRIDALIDQFVLSRATNVVAVTKEYQTHLRGRGLKNVLWCPTIPEVSALLAANPIPPERPEVTNLLYCGSLYGDLRDYRALVDGLVEANRNEQRFHLTVAGQALEPLLAYAHERDIADCVTSLGTIPWTEATGRMKGPVINVILLWNGPERFMIPSKLFECLVAGRPILAVGPFDDPVVGHLPTDLSVCAHTSSEIAIGLEHLAPLCRNDASPRTDFFETCQSEFNRLPQRLGLQT